MVLQIHFHVIVTLKHYVEPSKLDHCLHIEILLSYVDICMILLNVYIYVPIPKLQFRMFQKMCSLMSL